MTYISAILAGILYGISSYLPCSGTGFLHILNDAFAADYTAYAAIAMCELGAILAGVIYSGGSYNLLLRELQAGEKNTKHRKNSGRIRRSRLKLMLAIGTVPFVVSLLLRNPANQVGASLIMIALFTVITGFVVYRSAGRKGNGAVSQLTASDYLFLGFLQIFSVFPGLSKIALLSYGGAVRTLKKESVLRLAMVMAIPSLVLSFLYHLMMAVLSGFSGPGAVRCILLVIASFAASIASIRLLNQFISKYEYKFFAYFNWGLAIILFVLALIA